MLIVVYFCDVCVTLYMLNKLHGADLMIISIILECQAIAFLFLQLALFSFGEVSSFLDCLMDGNGRIDYT